MALPWLESTAPAAVGPDGSLRLSEPPLRMAFLFMPNGVRPDHWTPEGDAEDYRITPHLTALEPHKSEFLLLENLWHEKTVGRNGHWPKVPAWLSGGFVERSTGRDLDTGGVSVDQVAANHIGTLTPLPTFELGLDAPRTGVDNIGGGFARMYGSYISWRDPHTPAPKEIMPQLAFDRLFRTGGRAPAGISSVDPQHPSAMASLQRDDQSVLDLVLEDAKALRAKGSVADRAKIDEYLESVRSVERRMEAALKPQKRWINEGKFDVPRPGPGIPEDHLEHTRLMLDILLLAFWTDTTRVATFMFGDAQTGRDFSFIPGVKGNFHGISHHRNEPGQRAQYEAIVNWHMDQIGWLLGRMCGLDEGGKSLLDNSMLMFGSSLKDGNRHDPENLPLILAGRAKGKLRPGRRVRAPEKTPLCNLYLTMLDMMGVHEERFGDSTGLLEGLS
ncbi:MAG: DUF1552 domain-containing protein [Acidobacteria bacterium]|nr:DUF1552 domain-containing protein [Acidobacteriota bacterium]